MKSTEEFIYKQTYISRHATLDGRRHCSIRVILTGYISPFNQVSQASNVMIGTSHYHGPGGRTCRSSMEVCEPYTILSDLVNIGCVDFATERSDIREAEVVS